MLLKLGLLLSLLIPYSAFPKTHIFWYKAKTNNYSLTDCSPGPCLPQDAVVHEGKMVTGSWSYNNTGSLENMKLGYLRNEKERSAAYVWSHDINSIAQGKVKSAKLRAEYLDRWSEGRPFCVPGRLIVRCGVVDFSGTINALGGLEKISPDAKWADHSNIISDSMGFDASSRSLKAEELKTVIIPEGKKTRRSPGKLNGKFFEIDIAKQVNWILSHPGGQYGIIFLVNDNEKNSGIFSLHTLESSGSRTRFHGDLPWTQDANTCHILIEEDKNDPLVFDKGEIAVSALPAKSGVRALPEPFTIIRSDSVKIALALQDNHLLGKIQKVIFYSSFFNNRDSMIKELMIGEVNSSPYELWWNCRDIPDHNIGKLVFTYEIIRKDGNDSSFSLRQFVLDRNPTLKSNALTSIKSKKPVVIDGNMHEWRQKNGISFGGRDNKVTILSQWDTDFLYFGIRVVDTNVISHYPPGSPPYSGLYEHGLYDEDEIEIFFDPHNARSEIMDLTHRQFLIGAAGMTYRVTRDSGNVTQDLKPNVRSYVQVLGSLNNGRDRDTGYVMEYAIPWEVMGIAPFENLSMGLEFFNTDRDSFNGSPQHYSWSGTKASNLHNPSEWGTLVLREGHSALFVTGLLAAGLLLLLIPAGIIIKAKRRGARRENEVSASEKQAKPAVSEKAEIKKAKQYIEEHYKDREISRKKVAYFTGLSPEYFSSMFKKETGEGFVSYLINYRVKKAEALLFNTHKRISEIALETGFSNLDSFEKAFKKIKKVTPSDFRILKKPQI